MSEKSNTPGSVKSDRLYAVGVDVGGTFTDCAVIDPDGNVVTGKAPTTPADISIGFFDAVAAAGDQVGLSLDALLKRTSVLNHGTTTGINALVTGQTAKVVMVTTAGHQDAIRIMNRAGAPGGVNDGAVGSRPAPLLPREQVIEIYERVDSLGEVIVELADEELTRLAAAIGDQAPEAIAICLLWSFANNAHELRVRDHLTERFPDVPIACSYEVAPRVGVYPRAATTIMNASLVPVMGRYVEDIAARARTLGFPGEVMFVQNDGGLIPAVETKRFPILTTRSGPVAGVVGTGVVSQWIGDPNVLVADMGGTTFDVGITRDGKSEHRDQDIVEGQLTHSRVVNVESIGAGGGSIAWVDEKTGLLRVGPRSAGATPGPICYGRGGTEVTVTDADLVLGVLNPDRPLPGGVPLDYDAALEGMRALAERVGIDPIDCAAGIVEVVDSHMEDLVRRITIQRGQDPRELSLWVYGGASGAHAGLFARHLNVKRVVFPLGDTASVWSALGCTLLKHRREFHTSVFVLPPWDLDAIAQWLELLDERAAAYAARTGMQKGSYRLLRSANMKYGLQVHEVEVELPELHEDHVDADLVEGEDIEVGLPKGPVNEAWAKQVVAAFEEEYERQFGTGTGYSGAGVTMTALRVVIESAGREHATDQVSVANTYEDTVTNGVRRVFWRELATWVETPIIAGPMLEVYRRIEGPAVVEYPHTTLVARPGQTLWKEPSGNVVLDLDNPSVDMENEDLVSATERVSL